MKLSKFYAFLHYLKLLDSLFSCLNVLHSTFCLAVKPLYKFLHLHPFCCVLYLGCFWPRYPAGHLLMLLRCMFKFHHFRWSNLMCRPLILCHFYVYYTPPFVWSFLKLGQNTQYVQLKGGEVYFKSWFQWVQFVEDRKRERTWWTGWTEECFLCQGSRKQRRRGRANKNSILKKNNSAIWIMHWWPASLD